MPSLKSDGLDDSSLEGWDSGTRLRGEVGICPPSGIGGVLAL